MPDGAVVSFPDNMPPEAIKTLISTKFPDAVKQAAKPGLLEKAIEPITSYPSTQRQMAQESVDQMGRGVQQLTEPVSDWNTAFQNAAKGGGNIALGGLGYVASPINAALRTVVGKPLEENTGIPKELSETAASFALPIPKRIPAAAAAETKAPAAAELIGAAKSGYEGLKRSGIQYSPETTNALADHVISTLNQRGAYEHLADTVHKTVDILRKEGPVSLDEVRSVLEGLSTLKTDPESKIRRAAGLATDEIKQFIGRTEPQAASQLETANANYAAGQRANKIDQAQEIAGLRAGRAGYGGNSVNTMRQVLSPIVESAIKGNAKGFSPEEIRAMNDIVVGNTVTNTLRGVGQLSPSKGAIQTGLAIGSGGVTAGVGAASNKLATILTSKQIDRLNELVRKRSPAYEEAVSGAAAKYFDAADSFSSDPSKEKFARALVASRALANGLTRDGIEISSGRLLRFIQGPQNSGAEENPQAIPGFPSE